MKKEIDSFHIISLGCAKNTVDSGSMVELLRRKGLKEFRDATQADVIIVNTCGFISPAREESLQVLNKVASSKREDQFLIAVGCLSELEKEQIIKLVPNLDAVIGTRRWMDIDHVLDLMMQGIKTPYVHFGAHAQASWGERGVLRAAIQGGSAYLKIGDGCDRACSFCMIPMIKGPTSSRPIQEVVKDAIKLQEQGIKELVLISQDTTSYGRDINIKDGLVCLLEELVHSVPDIPWIRILYMFPGAIDSKLMNLMAAEKQILHYVDLPLQHAHPSVLRRMQRPTDMKWVRNTITSLRNTMPDIAIRTTFIVGFPGETEQKFQALADFIEEIQFDRVGFFPYYAEAGAASYSMQDSVPTSVKDERLQHLADLQEKISYSRNEQFLHHTFDVLVEGVDKEIVVGRSYRDAPEIDGLVIAVGRGKIGEIVSVKIQQVMAHDLFGKIVDI